MRIAIAVLAVLELAGCGNRCKDVQRARDALVRQGAPNRGADVRVTVPYDQANRVIAGLLAQEPVTMELAPPELRVFPVSIKPVAIVREAILAQPRSSDLPNGDPGMVRLATRFEIREGETVITDIAVVIEVRPDLVKGPSGTDLVIGFGPQNLVRVKPTLGPEAKQGLSAAVDRWVPARLRGKLPKLALDAAAKQLGVELTETAWDALRGTLMKRLGDITRMKLRLPDVPIARQVIHSTATGLVIELETDLPVRKGLAPGNGVVGPELGVRIAASAAAELANWALDHGHGPGRFNRNLRPAADGEFQPRFDYIAEDREHPLKVFSFQQRGGCSYHRVGVRGTIALDGDKLVAKAVDRDLEAQSANPAIEIGAWAQYFFTGWIDRSKRVAAHTQLSVGNRTLASQVVQAEISGDELVFGLRLEAGATTRNPGPGVARSPTPPISAARDTRGCRSPRPRTTRA